MKRTKLILPVTAFALLLSFGIVACGGGNGGQGGESQQQSGAVEEKMTIDAPKKTLILGETVQLTAKAGDNALSGVKWESEKPEIAEVSESGLVTSKAVGTAKITASKAGYKTTSVNIKVELQKITITGEKNSIAMEETLQLTASEQGVTWASDNQEVATVDQTGKVTGVKVGSAKITASKDGFDAGSFNITVTRPAALAELHFEKADHYAADGWWGTGDDGMTPLYARTDGNASDQECIAHFGAGDKETLSFTSTAAFKGELVITMAASSAIDDMSAVMSIKLNDAVVDLAGKGGISGAGSSQFEEFSLGELDVKRGSNALELEFKEASSYPYLDNLNIYAKAQATVAQVDAPEKQQITVATTAIAAYIDTETQIVLSAPTSMEGVQFFCSKEDIATVDADGKVTGHKLGAADITIAKAGWLSARVGVTVDKAGLPGEIRVQAEDAEEIPDGFHKYTDRTSGIQNGHYGGAYITGYDVNSACSLSYKFESPSAQTMTLIIAGAPHYNMTAGEVFSFVSDCNILLNEQKVTVKEGAEIEGTGAAMGAATVEIEIGDVSVKAGENHFVIEFIDKAPALDAFRFIPKA